jgi:hypothetical protein
MNQQTCGRMCAAAIKATIDNFGNCEKHMSAVDTLAESFRDVETMLTRLWQSEDSYSFGSFFYQVMHEWAAPVKQSALWCVTGKSRLEWLVLIAPLD